MLLNLFKLKFLIFKFFFIFHFRSKIELAIRAFNFFQRLIVNRNKINSVHCSLLAFLVNCSNNIHGIHVLHFYQLFLRKGKLGQYFKIIPTIIVLCGECYRVFTLRDFRLWFVAHIIVTIFSRIYDATILR